MSPGYIDPDYVDVAERIRLFYEKYPEGSLETVEHGLLHVGDRTFVYCVANAYRTSQDVGGCTGVAWAPVPGPTPFTRDSELMNAQTSAWGRAIVAAGIPSKKIASADEVRTAQESQTPVALPDEVKPVEKWQHNAIGGLCGDLDELTGEGADWKTWSRNWCTDKFGKRSRADLTYDEAQQLIAALKEQKQIAEAPFG